MHSTHIENCLAFHFVGLKPVFPPFFRNTVFGSIPRSAYLLNLFFVCLNDSHFIKSELFCYNNVLLELGTAYVQEIVEVVHKTVDLRHVCGIVPTNVVFIGFSN